MYRDRPKPTGSFLLINASFLASLLAIQAAVIASDLFPRWACAGVSVALALVYAYTLLVLHAAFYTVYTVADGAVELRAGVLIRRRIPVTAILCADRTISLSRVIGWGRGREGYCNRFTCGVRLIADGKKIYCSPTDSEAFIAVLRELGVPGYREATGLTRTQPQSELSLR